MYIFNVSFLVVLSCIAMIGATPIGGRSPDEAIDEYVTLQQFMEVLTFLVSLTARSIPMGPSHGPGAHRPEI